MDLQVKIIGDGSSDSIIHVLGIPENRATFLLGLCEDAFRTNTHTTDTISAVSGLTEHPNELAYISYIIGRMHEQNENAVMRKNLLNALFGKGGEL